MKIAIITVVAAAAVLIGSATQAEAGPGYSNGYRGAGYGAPSYRPPSNHGYGNQSHGRQSYHPNQGHCDQPYKVSTVEVNRYTQCQTAYDHCGRPYTIHVTVVTYCDHYSNGTSRTWTQTFS